MSDYTPKLPEVKFNKNGYEIRTDVLAMAKDAVMEEYHSKFRGWEMSVQKDEKTGQVVTRVDMPEFPGLEKIMEAAEKFYGFVNAGTKK
jgi:isocitrate dehydrogenase